GNVLNLNIVRDHELLEPLCQNLSNFRIAIDKKTIWCGGNKYVSVYLSLRIEHACFNHTALVGFADIVRNLPIQKTKTITSLHAKFCAGEKIKKAVFGRDHPSWGEATCECFLSWRPRRTSCLRKPRRSWACSVSSSLQEVA